MTTKQLSEQIRELARELRENYQQMSEDERKSKIATLNELRNKYDDLKQIEELAQIQQETDSKPITQGNKPQKGIVEAIIESDAFKQALTTRGMRPYVVQNVTIPTPTYNYTTLSPALVPTSQLVGTLVSVGTRQAANTLYARETTTSLKGSAAPRSKGAPKPTTNITYESVQSIAQSIAHLVKVAEEDLNDIAALRQTIEQRGINQILATEEDQVVNGNGTAPNLLGILNTTGVVTATQGTDTLIDAIVKLIGTLEGNGANVTTIAVNPSRWADLVLAKDTTGAYLNVVVDDRLFGVPIVRSPFVAANRVIVGDNRYATLWRVQGVTVAVGTEGDDFARNLVSIRIEERAALDVYRPQAYGVLTLA
jgi:HK97 family phage major capsid protein